MRIAHDTQEGSTATLASPPPRQTELPPWPSFDHDEVEAAAAVLQSGRVNYWTGQEGRRFEEEFAQFVGCQHAVAVANGTVALELALEAAGLGPGDDVILTSRTFIASASSIVMRGARPIMADVDSASQNVTAQTIREALTPRTAAIVAVHLAGWPCEMDPILELARERGLKVIEDCAQAHGATYRGQMVGTLGDVAAFSFCQDKIMTTGGEGGMVTTNSRDIWERAWRFKDHGKSWEKIYHQPDTGVFRWVHESFGTNWRLTEMQSAIGRVQLRKLPQWLARRRRNATILTERLEQIPALRIPRPPRHIEHAYYKYYIFLRPEMLKEGWDRDRIVQTISAEGIPCGSGSCSEIYLEGAFQESRLQPAERLPVAKALGETSLVLVVHPTLSESNMQEMARVVEKALAKASVRASSQRRSA